MPLPAGTGLSRRSFLPARAGSRSPSSAAPRSARARSTPASPPPRRPARTACSSRSSAPAAWTRCRCSRPSATPATRRCAARSRCRRPGVRVRRGHPPALAPERRAAARPARRRQAERDPGDRLRRPQPVALHLAPLLGGRRASTRPAASAGSAATSTATAPPTTRSRASRSTTRWRPSLATAGVPVAAVSAPESYDLWARDVWDDAMFDAAVDALGRARARRDRRPRARHRPPRGGHEHRAAHPARRAAGPHGRLAGRRRLPGSAERVPATGSPSLAEMIGRGLPLRVVALDANGGYDTHENQAATLQANLGLLSALAGRLPGRPRGARDRRPRARARLERVRPPAAGQRLGHRPRRRRREPGDGHAGQGHDGRRVPRPGDARRAVQPPPHGRLPRASTRASRSSGSGSTRTASSRAPSGFTAPAAGAMRVAAGRRRGGAAVRRGARPTPPPRKRGRRRGSLAQGAVRPRRPPPSAPAGAPRRAASRRRALRCAAAPLRKARCARGLRRAPR